MAAEANPLAMSKAVPFPLVETEAKRALEEVAQELLDARFTAFQHAANLYERNPTTDNWRTLIRARACYAVAFHAEHGGSLK